MPIRKLIDYLDSHKIDYVTINHSTAYTAQQIAASAHIPGKELAKTVIIKVDGDIAMAVLPASEKVDFDLLRNTVGSDFVELATEREFKDVFPDCEIGAMPPFGNLYDSEVYLSESLVDNDFITFNACNHRELIRMSMKDYDRLIKPKVMRLSFQR